MSEGPTVDIKEAAHILADLLDRQPWLSSIGVGGCTAPPSIVVYLKCQPVHRPALFDKGWMGHPVQVVMFGEFAPMGKVPGVVE